MLSLLIILLTLAIFIISAYTDIKTLEVPDWLTYSGIAAGLGLALIESAQQWTLWPFASHLFGFLIATIIACFLFYGGQWGGGDAKLLMASGALIGFELDKFSFGITFLINLVFLGAAWGIFWSAIKATTMPKRISKTILALAFQNPYKQIFAICASAGILFISLGILFSFARFALVLGGILLFILFGITLFVKSVELCAMYRWVSVDMLTEGDWLVHTISIGSQRFEPPKLGLEKKHLRLLRKLASHKKIDKILVKYGIPFTPAFLLSFIATLAFGNVVLATLF